jgi:hypothetical protein
MQFSASGHQWQSAFAGRVFSPTYPVGAWGQMLGRGLAPRWSIGTLQLSIRCSSIHFLPSRCFPVSGVGEFEFQGRIAALDAGRIKGSVLRRRRQDRVDREPDNE